MHNLAAKLQMQLKKAFPFSWRVFSFRLLPFGMSTIMSATMLNVASFLAASQQAHCDGNLGLGFGRHLSLWRNQDDRISYRNPEGHTFGFYRQGGNGTRRVDGVPRQGWSGAVCILPEGMDSDWEITAPFSFMHLYLSDQELRHCFAETFEADSRLMELSDETYFEAPTLVRPFEQLHAAAVAGDHLQAEEAVTELVHAVFAAGVGVSQRRHRLTGGLAPHQLRRIREFALADLSQQITLRDLATLTGLSEFHLQRSFRQSTGMSPHQWLMRKRLDQAKDLIRAGEALAEVAAATGFSNQSHLSRSFKAHIGLTPGAYARLA